MSQGAIRFGLQGYIQLALRTGQYKRLNVLKIKSGELGGWDPFEERFHEMHFIEDFEKRAAMPTVGYIAHFEYINGFEKTLYWTADQMMSHADKYSPAFSAAAYKKLLNGEIRRKICGNIPAFGTGILTVWQKRLCCAS